MAPFGKHPLYPLALVALNAMGGMTAMVLLSVFGTVASAGFAALLARKVTGGLERTVLWAVGVASPLLFDAYLLIAHALGAALVAAATLAVVSGVRRERPAPALAASGLLMALAVMLRSEALIFALALGGAIVTLAAVRRHRGMAAWGVAVGAAGVVAAYVEKWLTATFIGGSKGTLAVPAGDGSFVGARVEAFLNTWIRPSLETLTAADTLLIVVMAMALAAVVVLRGRISRPYVLLILSTAATVMSAAAFLTNEDRVIPGLLIAYPLAMFGIGLVDRTYFSDSGRLVLTVSSSLFIAGVLATQYRVGGSAEWGGRYFALVIPALTVLAVDALSRRTSGLPTTVRRGAVAGLVACSAFLAVGALTSMNSWHGFYERMLTGIDGAGQATSIGDGGKPVVVSAYPNIARRGWPTLSNQRWLYTSDPALAAELAVRLDDRGIEEFVLVSQDADDLEPYLGRYGVDHQRSFTMRWWKISVLVART
jgi:hypothetical protein